MINHLNTNDGKEDHKISTKIKNCSSFRHISQRNSMDESRWNLWGFLNGFIMKSHHMAFVQLFRWKNVQNLALFESHYCDEIGKFSSDEGNFSYDRKTNQKSNMRDSFLLVRFLWRSKENERNDKSIKFICSIPKILNIMNDS